jgi:tRNA (cytidine/uridine-2'-O-)-methyltransferase
MSSTSPQPRERLGEIPVNAPLHLALHEPQIPPNAGNVARLCAATGCALHLIEPLGFSIDDRELKRAGLDYWHAVAVTVHPSLEAFIQRVASRPIWLFSARAIKKYGDAAIAFGDVLLFGKETAGLPQTLLDQYPERTLRIPMRPDATRSLNLSTAVGIVAYAALGRLGFPGLS